MHKSAMTMFLNTDHLLDGVNFLEPRILKKTEPSDAEDCVEDVDHVSRSICKTTQIRILQKSEGGHEMLVDAISPDTEE
jgi:hypothetical protein